MISEHSISVSRLGVYFSSSSDDRLLWLSRSLVLIDVCGLVVQVFVCFHHAPVCGWLAGIRSLAGHLLEPLKIALILIEE